MKRKIIFLVGPTAIGKSETAILLAKKINAEIVSCDSMQIYKGMDIITSKPKEASRRRIPHHLIGIISPGRQYNVSLYRKQALKEISRITKRGRVPLFVGGTGLYMSVLIDGIFPEINSDKKIRKKLYWQAERSGSAQLYERLKIVDPEAALKIHPNDTRRLVRALEVFEVTGQPISKLQKQRKGLGGEYDVVIFCLNTGRDILAKRIKNRIDRMFRQGLLEEVRKLLKVRLSRTAACAIGIQELRGFFSKAYGLKEAKLLMVRNTRQYAKRQLTWFRKDKRIHWINIGANDTPAKVSGVLADKILKG